MMKIAEIRITEAVWPEDRAPIARLMREYVEALEADISFQDFESECAGLPGKYARPEGVVLIGRTANDAVGIVAYRPLEHRICEMKRLYVLPRFRGTGLGRLLVEESIRLAARQISISGITRVNCSRAVEKRLTPTIAWLGSLPVKVAAIWQRY